MTLKYSGDNFEELLTLYLEGDLDEAGKTRFESYLATSAEYRQHLQDLEKNAASWRTDQQNLTRTVPRPSLATTRKMVAGWKNQPQGIAKSRLALVGLAVVLALAVITLGISLVLTPASKEAVKYAQVPTATPATTLEITSAITAPQTQSAIVANTPAPPIISPAWSHRSTYIDWSPDGKVLASIEEGVQLWSPDGKLIKTLDGLKGANTLAWSPDGKFLAASGDEKEPGLKIWAANGTLSGNITSNQSVFSFIWSPDSKAIAVIDKDNTDSIVQLWNTQGQQLSSFKIPASANESSSRLDWSPDGKFIAVYSGRPETITIWTKEGNLVANLKANNNAFDVANDFSWSPDSQMLAVATVDNGLSLWDTSGKLIKTLSDIKSGFMVVWSPDSKAVAMLSFDRKAAIWDKAGKLITMLDIGPTKGALTLTWSPDSKTIVTASEDRFDYIKLWSADGKLLKTIPSPNRTQRVLELQWSPDGKTFATWGNGNNTPLQIWSAEGNLLTTPTVTLPTSTVATEQNGTPAPNPLGHSDIFRGLEWSPDGKVLATSALDRTVKLWDTQGKLLISNKVALPVEALGWSPDSKVLATVTTNGVIQLLDASGKELKNFQAKADRGYLVLQWSATGKAFFTVTLDNVIQVWSAEGKLLATFEGRETMDTQQWSPDGLVLAVSLNDKLLLLNPEGQTLAALVVPDRVTGLKWSSDSQVVAVVVDMGNKFQLWSKAGKLINTINHPVEYPPNRLKWSPDSKLLAICSSSLDGASITLFDTTGKELTNFKLNNSSASHADPTFSWSPDGKRLLTTRAEKKVEIWDTQGKLVAELQADNEVMLIVWSPDGSQFATATRLIRANSGPQLQLWDVNGKLLKSLPGPFVGQPISGGVVDIAWSLDSKALAVHYIDSKHVWLWTAAGQPLASLSDQ